MASLRETLENYGQDELLEQLIRLSPKNYEEFINTLYSDLDFIVGLIEADAKDYHDASEDELNRQIVRLLSARFYRASHDHDEGGHVDVRVTSRDGKYSWLAEAKLDKGPAYLKSGMHQLTERYARGTPNHNAGGFLVYIQKAKCAERFSEWRMEFGKHLNDFEDLSIEDCPNRKGLAFFSEFVLPRIGVGVPKYRVRHVGVSAFRPASTSP